MNLLFDEIAIILAHRRKDIQNFGGFQRGGLVFHAPADYEAVPSVRIECLTTHIQMQCTLHHIHKLMMRMAMSRSHPALFKIMPYQHQLIAVS